MKILFRLATLLMVLLVLTTSAAIVYAKSDGQVASAQPTSITPEWLGGIAGVILALAFRYIPGLSTKYDQLDKGIKQSIMGVLLVVVAVVIFSLACANLGGDLGLSIACNKASAIELASILISALMANQSTYLLTRQ